MKRKQFIISLADKPTAELERMIKEREHALQTMRFDLLSGKVKNVKSITAAKKEVARLKTKLSELSRSAR